MAKRCVEEQGIDVIFKTFNVEVQEIDKKRYDDFIREQNNKRVVLIDKLDTLLDKTIAEINKLKRQIENTQLSIDVNTVIKPHTMRAMVEAEILTTLKNKILNLQEDTYE